MTVPTPSTIQIPLHFWNSSRLHLSGFLRADLELYDQTALILNGADFAYA
ncbi:hypothetical protein AGR2A_Cc30314 [Agrobacterium genomosp. 2 str. CFBP 5494]|uniref:Uncharacterized protein n=1 Tax=Agrobacterium genomosp. 2 str. CFBP 5494 TaxID=1183436 RepID=A0A9W5B1R2_9HYPH|nr:hypothetical protein AGR2A_Cc30314 [Agrobacterium genomosp. 2 str. CFBP 5494]